MEESTQIHERIENLPMKSVWRRNRKWIIVCQAYSCDTKTRWQAASSADIRLFPLPVLAWARQRPAEGQTGFESTNGVGGNGREANEWRRERRTTEVCVLVTQSRLDPQRERGVGCTKRPKQSLIRHREVRRFVNRRLMGLRNEAIGSFGLTNKLWEQK